MSCTHFSLFVRQADLEQALIGLHIISQSSRIVACFFKKNKKIKKFKLVYCGNKPILNVLLTNEHEAQTQVAWLVYQP